VGVLVAFPNPVETSPAFPSFLNLLKLTNLLRSCSSLFHP